MRGSRFASATFILLCAVSSLAAQMDAQAAFGVGSQDLWIAATQFNGRLTGSSGDLTYAAGHYFNNPASPVPSGYFAQVDLPAGAVITQIQCDVFDDSFNNDLSFELQKYWHDYQTNSPNGLVITIGSSTGAAGYQQPISPVISETVRYTEGTHRNLYYIYARIASDTSLRGCRVEWHRSISPAPGSATFADVPTNHPLFRFVEALVASGITGGCGGGNYCPDAPLTRGQMSVFLSGALGLHFPN